MMLRLRQRVLDEEVFALKLTDEEKVRVDGSRVCFSAGLGLLLTKFSAGVADEGHNDPPRDIYKSFDILGPGDVTPEAEEDMIRFLLVRLRFAEEFLLFEEADKSRYALCRWGADAVEIFDSVSGVGWSFAASPMSTGLLWPPNVHNIPTLSVKARANQSPRGSRKGR